MIYIINQEGLYQNKVNSSLVSICNCKMVYYRAKGLNCDDDDDDDGRPDFTKKKQQQSRVFCGVIFYVYNNVDNRERAKASYWKQRRRISLEEKHGNLKRRWENEEC